MRRWSPRSTRCNGLIRRQTYVSEEQPIFQVQTGAIAKTRNLGARLVSRYGPAQYDLTKFSCHRNTSADARHTSGTR